MLGSIRIRDASQHQQVPYQYASCPNLRVSTNGFTTCGTLEESLHSCGLLAYILCSLGVVRTGKEARVDPNYGHDWVTPAVPKALRYAAGIQS